jgi:hypothetical protein
MYEVVNRSTNCSGFSVSGSYTVSGDQLNLNQTNSSVPDATNSDIVVGFSFNGQNALNIMDGTRTYTYHRQ